MNKPDLVIDVIAPSGKIKDPETLPLVEAFLKTWGHQPRLGKYLLGNHTFLSNALINRFDDLKQALFSPENSVIWCYRGGSGAMELLPLLSQLNPSAQQKLFLGFSDITALHIFFNQVWGWKTFHGPGARQIAANMVDDISEDYVKKLLANQLSEIIFSNIKLLNNPTKKIDELTTKIIGGNLAVISHLLGTPYQPQTSRKLLLLEEINEPAYKIRRALTHLQQAGLFENITGILFGAFMHENNGQQDLIMQELQEFATTQPFPVSQTNEIGHGKTNVVIPLGCPVVFRENFSRMVF